MTLHGTHLNLLATIAGTGGTLAVHAPDDGHAVYLTTVIAGATVTVGLEADDARQLVAVLERQLRAQSTERRLDPAGLCRCGDARVSHRDLEGPCLAPECPCLVMRPVATVPFGTPYNVDQVKRLAESPPPPFRGLDPATWRRAGFWDE